MRLFAPTYYKNFKCIADRCEHSCCIGWEIDIDGDSAEKYRALKSGYGAVLANSVCWEETPHFRLADHDRCPHLNGQGLCNVILNLGEDYLCDICREHPRFYNYTDVAEVGIGMSCPEAARVILACENFSDTEEIGEVDAVRDDILFDGRRARAELYALLGNGDYTSALDGIYRTYCIDAGEDREWLETLESLEYLDAAHKPLFLHYSSQNRPFGKDKDEYLKRFLAYLIYRHCTEAFDEEELSARLAFCLFCERLLASLIVSQGADSLQEIATLASILSEEIEYSSDNTSVLTWGE